MRRYVRQRDVSAWHSPRVDGLAVDGDVVGVEAAGEADAAVRAVHGGVALLLRAAGERRRRARRLQVLLLPPNTPHSSHTLASTCKHDYSHDKWHTQYLFTTNIPKRLKTKDVHVHMYMYNYCTCMLICTMPIYERNKWMKQLKHDTTSKQKTATKNLKAI